MIKVGDRVFVRGVGRYGTVERKDPVRGVLVRYEGHVIPEAEWHFETRVVVMR